MTKSKYSDTLFSTKNDVYRAHPSETVFNLLVRNSNRAKNKTPDKLIMEADVKKKGIIRRFFNRILHLAARFGPGAMTLRPYLHKLRGVKIRERVFIGEDVYIENEYPENIEIHDDAQIALRTTLIAHLRGAGKIIIGNKVWIGTGCIIAAGPNKTLKIGDCSVLAAGSVVTRDVPPNTFAGGVPAKPIAKVTVPMTVDTPYEDFKNGLVPLDSKD